MAGFMAGFKSSKFYPLFQKLLRTLQFLSALSSLVVFSIRIRKLLQLYNGLSRADGAVEGIVAAAVAYTLAVLLLNLLLKNGGPKILRWILVVLDLAFVGAFIAVAVLTSPKNGKAGPCNGTRRRIAEKAGLSSDASCNLPLGTFVTAIVSTILHALTATFQNVRQHHREHQIVKEESGYNGSPQGRTSTNPIIHDNNHHNTTGHHATNGHHTNGHHSTAV